MHITVRIERLILEGLPIVPGQASLVQAAVEAELGRLLAAGALDSHLLAGGALPALAADAIQLSGAGDPAALGTQIAHAVYGGIGQQGDQGNR
jgi:hypothetical protein